MPDMVISATLCCGCGVCESLACNQGISPKAVIDNYKRVLSKNRLRFDKNGEYEIRSERDYRMIPYKKWMSALGVSNYDKDTDYYGEINDFDRVELTLSRHIGVPSIPAVNDGDIVRAGDLIASAADGLSLPQHASISGKVTLGKDKIIIDKVR
jgi:Na+-translocating ferredoxin:NAD+ oxidoreductase RnfC subunit